MELVQQTTESSVFLTMSKFNEKTESIPAEIFLSKNYDVISADESQRAYICFERLRVSAQGTGADSLYFSKTSSDEFVIVKQFYEDDFDSSDYDEKTDTTAPSFEILRKYSKPSNVRLRFKPGAGVNNKGWLPDIKENLLLKASELRQNGFFRWMKDTTNAGGGIQKPGDYVFNDNTVQNVGFPLAVCEDEHGQEAVFPLYQLVSQAHFDANAVAGGGGIADWKPVPLSTQVDSTVGSAVMISNMNANTKYTIKSLAFENHGKIANESLIKDGEINYNVAKFYGGYRTKNLELIQVEVIPPAAGGNAAGTIRNEGNRTWQIRVPVASFERGGFTKEELLQDMLKGKLALYGIQKNNNGTQLDHRLQFTIMPGFEAVDSNGVPINNPLDGTSRWEFRNASVISTNFHVFPAAFDQLNIGANEYLFVGLETAPNTYVAFYERIQNPQQFGNFYYRDNPAFYEHAFGPGATFAYIQTDPNGAVLQNALGQMERFSVRVKSFFGATRFPVNVNQPQTHWSFTVSPLASFETSLGKQYISNGASATGQVTHWYLDTPNRFRNEVPTAGVLGDFVDADYLPISHEVRVYTKLSTRLTDVVKTTLDPAYPLDAAYYNELFPVFGNCKQEGTEIRYSLDKYCYSPNELFSYFNTKFFRLGVDEEGHFMLEIKKHPQKFELEISQAFMDKYDLNKNSVCFQSDGEVLEEPLFTTTGVFQTPLLAGKPQYISHRTPAEIGGGTFEIDGQIYTKIGDSVEHSETNYEVSLGTHQKPEETIYGTYKYNCGGLEEALRSNGQLTVEGANTYSELSVVSTGLGFNPQIGQDSSNMRILASFEIPFDYQISTSGSPLKCCDIQCPPIGDIIVMSDTAQYLRLTSAKSVRYLRFLIQKVTREGVASFMSIPERGMVALKLRFLITK